MSLTTYMQLETFNPAAGSNILAGEAQVTLPIGPLVPNPQDSQGLIEVSNLSFSMEQTLNLGSTSSGSGAGKVTFNPFAITKRIDRTSPIVWEMLCAGTAFKTARLFMLSSTGGGGKGIVAQRLEFSLVGVKTIAFSVPSDGAPLETITFEVGSMQLWNSQQMPDGTLGKPVTGGWDRVKNVKFEGPLD